MTVEREWSVTRRKWALKINDENTEMELRGMEWEIHCPAGHPLYTPFASLSVKIDVPCRRCRRQYPAMLVESVNPS